MILPKDRDPRFITIRRGGKNRGMSRDGSIDDDEIEDMIRDSYDLVAAKLTRAQRADLGL